MTVRHHHHSAPIAPARAGRTVRAFTLIELILVMLVLSIIAGMVVPSLGNFGKGQGAGNCAAQIVSLMHWARTQAIARGTSYRFNLDPQTQTYWLTVQAAPGFDFEPVSEEFGRVFSTPDGVAVEWDVSAGVDGQYVEFRPSGRCDPATLRVLDAQGNATVVTCPSATELFQVVPRPTGG